MLLILRSVKPYVYSAVNSTCLATLLTLISLLTQVKERMERQTSVWNIEPGPSDWQSSAPSTKPLLRTKVCLFILCLVHWIASFWGQVWCSFTRLINAHSSPHELKTFTNGCAFSDCHILYSVHVHMQDVIIWFR